MCVCVCIDIWMIYSDTTNTNLTYITKSTRYITFDKYVILRWLTYRCTFKDKSCISYSIYFYNNLGLLSG